MEEFAGFGLNRIEYKCQLWHQRAEKASRTKESSRSKSKGGEKSIWRAFSPYHRPIVDIKEIDQSVEEVLPLGSVANPDTNERNGTRKDSILERN